MSRLRRLGLYCLLLPAFPAHAQDLNIASELLHGGLGIVAIGALSVLALAVTCERLANFRLAKVAPPDLAAEAETLWRAGRFDQLRERVADGDSSLTACGDKGVVTTSVGGSVAANGFGALSADTSLKDKDGSYKFRWVACAGGAGEVVAHLDRADPPAGRCERARSASN